MRCTLIIEVNKEKRVSEFKELVDDCCLSLRKISERWGESYNTLASWSCGRRTAPNKRITQLRKLKKTQDKIFGE